jgi:HK97 family phage prohead protease
MKTVVTNENMQIREAVLRALTPEQIENRTAEFVISSEAKDTYGTVFKLSGWDLQRYNANPLVCYNHYSWGTDPDTIIGTSEVFVDGDVLVGRVRFETEDINPKAEKVWKKVQAGTLRMASVGVNVKRGHWGDDKLGEDTDTLYFDEHELLEWSVVAIGSNPDAVKRNAENFEEIKLRFKNNEVPPVVETPTEKLSVREAQLNYNLKKFK